MKITKKLLKELTQANVAVDPYNYTEDEYRDLLRLEGVFDLETSQLPIRVSLRYIDTIDIRPFDGQLFNVATLKTGQLIFVTI